MNRFHTQVMLATVLFTVCSTSAFAAGACCSVIGGGSLEKIALTIDASYADTHEEFQEQAYQLLQTAINCKAIVPVKYGFAVSIHAGVPVASRLTDNPSSTHGHAHSTTAAEQDYEGNGGIISGIGVSYSKEIAENWNASAGVTMTRSYSTFTRSNAGSVDQSITIREQQITGVVEWNAFKTTSLFSGIRMYEGSNTWKDRKQNTSYNDFHAWNVAPVIGARYRWSERANVVASVGIGHANIVSVGFVTTVPKPW